MKVILVKDYKNHKVNDVIEVAPGFGSNFLIKNGYALPFNEKTNLVLSKRLDEIAKEDERKRKEAIELKEKLQAIILEFKLKETNNVIHGSITGKKVHKALEEHGLKMPKHSIEHVHIASMGITVIDVKLYKDIHANLRVKVIKDE